MIAHSPFNRQIIKDYLENASEDEFIDDIICPLFGKNGYILYRMNSHGPGEHGKDIIFYRHVPLFYDQEFIVVQAKAERVTACNVTKFANQLTRAIRVPFPAKGGGQRQANYVMFINSKTHSNDVDFEFHHLVDEKNNIKILSQENIIEMIIQFDLRPADIDSKLEKYDSATQNFEDSIREIIYSGDNVKINKFMDKQLKLESRPLSSEIKSLIINYIFDKWEEDPTWDGIVRPMKWLNLYFDFIQPEQYGKLLDVFKEYGSSNPSYKAQNDTSNIIAKIRPEQINFFKDDFLKLIIQKVKDMQMAKYPLLKLKFEDFVKSGFLTEDNEIIVRFIEEFSNLKDKIMKEPDMDMKKELRPRLVEIQDIFYKYLYPDDDDI